MDPSDPPCAQRALAQPAPPGGRILFFADPLRIARCPFVSHIGHFEYASSNDLRGASRTTGPKSSHAFRTGLGSDLIRSHRPETCSLQRAPRLRTTRSGGSPEPIGILGNLRPQVAKLRTLGTVVLAGRIGDFFARQARDRAFPYYWTFLQPLQTIAASGELTILGG